MIQPSGITVHITTTTIERSNIESLTLSVQDQDDSTTPSAAYNGNTSSNHGMIGNEHPEDVTWLSAKIVMFDKRRISRTQNSRVYHGRQELYDGRNRDVAIKLIQYSDNNMREIQALTNLDHPNIVQIYDAGAHRGTGYWIYIVMELCSKNLEEYIQENQPNPTRSFHFFRQIVAAVDFMHERNIAHRDIKPTNVLISRCGQFIKFSDFGISKEIPQGLSTVTDSCTGVGTEGYKAPELYIAAHKVSLKSDIFSLGLVAAYLLTNGKHPFGEDPHDWSYNIRKNKIFDLSQILDGTPWRDELIILIGKMLRHEPCDRPTMQQIKQTGAFTSECLEAGEIEVGGDSRSASQTENDGDRESVPQATSETNSNGNKAIVLFDNKSKQLYRVDHEQNAMTEMQRYHPNFGAFSTASLHGCVYVFDRDLSVYRLIRRPDGTAAWQQMNDWIGDKESDWPTIPRVVASHHEIFFVGGGISLYLKAAKSVFRYKPSIDRWVRLADKPSATFASALACSSEYLYCIGGNDEDGKPSSIVERMELETTKWTRIANMNQERFYASAAEYQGNIYLVDNTKRMSEIEMYDPKVNQWTEMQSIDLGDTGIRRTFAIDGYLYAVCSDRITKYHIKTGEWDIVTTYNYMNVGEAVLIKTTI